MSDPSEELPEIQIEELLDEAGGTAAPRPAPAEQDEIELDLDLDALTIDAQPTVGPGAEAAATPCRSDESIDIELEIPIEPVAPAVAARPTPAIPALEPVPTPAPAVAPAVAARPAPAIPALEPVPTLAPAVAPAVAARPAPAISALEPVPTPAPAVAPAAAARPEPATPALEPVPTLAPAVAPAAVHARRPLVTPSRPKSLDLDALLSDIDLSAPPRREPEAQPPGVLEPDEAGPLAVLDIQLPGATDESAPDVQLATPAETAEESLDLAGEAPLPASDDAPPLPLLEDEPPAVPAVPLASLVPDANTFETLKRMAGAAADPGRARAALYAAIRGEPYEARHLPDARAMMLGIARALAASGLAVDAMVEAVIDSMLE